ncbi:terminase [Thermoclostridium stercorarium subsp. thermolacticum DSM 2910]|uniref:Terminase n=1 Tax=Thermoclostridium stercorarium subsp. thermolacticum DSM 2910 TaxID=1121336 RepID=A0A1B1YAC1_THEST|nr:terminase TerL endonuclease subunit [Thermoclostridium stercorarium]ANW97714.1 terminase [Thermoclostridium stercorarium subsp. thermolacticum DSM 2910]
MNWILKYWEEIKNGNIIVCQKVYKIYKRLVEEINNPKGDWVFDEEKANRPIEFIERFCKQSKGEWIGQPLKLQLFQKAYISALFGFVHKETGFRRFKETLFLVARKNGKSSLLSGIALYMLMADGEGGAEVYSVATRKDQARIVFSEAVNMVRQSPALSKHLKKRKTDLYMPMTFSKFEPLASDSNTLDGLNSHCVIIDELHAIKDRNLYEVMKQSMSARRQPLLVMITTAGTVRECIYDDMYDYACKVVDGIIEDDRFLPVLYELDDREEWTDWRMWQKANPGLGTIKKLEDLVEKVERAKANPKDLPGLLTKDFNIRETTSGSWLTFEEINNTETFDMEELKGSYAVGGVDLSSTTDLTCATLLIMKPGSDKKYCIQQYFLPEDLVEQRVKEDKIPYDKWAKRGLLTLCPGNKVNYSDVTAWFMKMYQEYGIIPFWIGYDPWNSQYWIEEMKGMGFTMIEVRQGAKTLSQPMKEMGADLCAKRINYNNNPILKWCLTNTNVKRDDNDNIRPVKGQNNRQRIDGTVSLLIAYTVLFNNMQDYKNLIGW